LLKVGGTLVSDALSQAEELMKTEKDLSPAVKAMMTMLLLVVRLLMNRLGINSSNSSTSPSQDPNRVRGSKKTAKDAADKKKPGGQKGRTGHRLNPISSPDVIKVLKLDQRTLPKGHVYTEIGYEARQVFDIEIKRIVTEYQAQILVDEMGKRYVAEFPPEATKDAQYGLQVKAHAVYMSQYQLIPYARVQDYFSEQMHLPLSVGTLCNFNKAAYDLLEEFERIAKLNLVAGAVLHADETGININKKLHWLHVASNGLWTHFYPHEKRGSAATNEIGILPKFKGVLCHDHWKPYYIMTLCLHSLCNAHHLRELTRAFEQDNQRWAKALMILLLEIKKEVDKSGKGMLDEALCLAYQTKYLAILKEGRTECPDLPPPLEPKKRRGPIKQSKSRNLLERLIDYHQDVLRFMSDPVAPFTNNQAENDLRMTKVHQKISGCFRSNDGALIFCRIRGYLSSCRKHGVNMTEALTLLFQGKMPDFVYDSI
jgi:transposase